MKAVKRKKVISTFTIQRESAQDDLERYITKRKARDTRLAKTFEEGYRAFMVGALLQSEREKAGLTQDELARLIGTTKTAISRLESGKRDIRFSTIERVAQALGRVVFIELKAA